MSRGFGCILAFCVIADAGAADGVVGPGNCDEAGFTSVLATVDGSGGGTVTFDCGDATFAFTSYKSIQNDVTIDGATHVTFDGGDSSAFFSIAAGANVTLQHLTLQHGAFAGVHALENLGHLRLWDTRVILTTSAESAVFNYGRMDVLSSTFGGNASDGAGGAISNVNPSQGPGSVLVVAYSAFEENTSASSGGAIYSDSSFVYLTGVTLSSNQATDGGAVDAFGGGLYVLASSFTDNHATAGSGGAIRLRENTLDLSRSNLVFNTAATNGGGVSCEVDALIQTDIYATTFADNTANGNGGGAYSECDSTYAEVTFNANAANGDGGAIVEAGTGAASVDFATLNANTAASGGGLFADGGGVIAIGHSIVSANTGGNCAGALTSNGYNLSDDAGCAAAFTATGDVLDASLPLMELGDYGGGALTEPPASDSAAIDHIPPEACNPVPPGDARGAMRPIGAGCDSGAVELGGVIDEIFASSLESG